MGTIDYYDVSTADGTSDSISTTDTTDTSSTTCYSVDSTSSTTVRKRVIVPVPEDWDDEVIEEYIELVNNKTSTGWKVTMLIKGNILIVDPTIEKRLMKDFIPLLKHGASNHDKFQIDKFFRQNPV